MGKNGKLIVHIDEGKSFPDLCGSAIELITKEGFDSKLISTALIIIDPIKESVKHYHKIMDEIYFILEGNGEIVLDNRIHSVKPGHSIYIPALVSHQIKNTGGSALKFLSIDSPPYDDKDVYLSK